MNVGKTLFAQTMQFVPWTSFSRIVQRYEGNLGVRTLSCTEQFPPTIEFKSNGWPVVGRDVRASQWHRRS